MNAFGAIVDSSTSVFRGFGEVFILLWDTLRYIAQRAVAVRDWLHQMAHIGVDSLPAALPTVISSGAVVAYYISQQATSFGLGEYVGGGIALAMAREVVPISLAIIIVARVGSTMAAEIGTMKITEQLDALRSLAVDPVEYLVVPRFLACVVMMPVLFVVGLYGSCVGGYIVAAHEAGVSSIMFTDSVRQFLKTDDITGGIIKSIVFGIIIVLVSCHAGLNARGGAAGVGRASTRAVVVSIIAIYVSNYFLVKFLWPN